MNVIIIVLNSPCSVRMKVIFSCQLVLCFRDWFTDRTEWCVVLEFDWQKQSARVCLHASWGLSFLISSLSNLDHLEGSWATRPQIQVGVSCLCTVDNQARHTVIFLLCFKEFLKKKKKDCTLPLYFHCHSWWLTSKWYIRALKHLTSIFSPLTDTVCVECK